MLNIYVKLNVKWLLKICNKKKIFNALDFGKLKRILRNKADLLLKLAS